MSRNKNVTFIEDLAELEDLESSDMTKYGGSAIRTNQRVPEVNMYQQQFQPFNEHPIPPPRHFAGELRYNCVGISDHIGNCPICSKLYSNDKTMYIIAIVILAIIVILLLKKVLEL